MTTKHMQKEPRSSPHNGSGASNKSIPNPEKKTTTKSEDTQTISTDDIPTGDANQSTQDFFSLEAWNTDSRVTTAAITSSPASQIQPRSVSMKRKHVYTDVSISGTDCLHIARLTAFMEPQTDQSLLQATQHRDRFSGASLEAWSAQSQNAGAGVTGTWTATSPRGV